MNISSSLRDVVSETAIVETLRKHLLTDVVYKLVDVTKAQKYETCYLSENGDLVLTPVKVSGYVNTMFPHNDSTIGKRRK